MEKTINNYGMDEKQFEKIYVELQRIAGALEKISEKGIKAECVGHVMTGL